MKPGTAISGAAHGALVAAAIFGLPWLSPRDREPISVTSVTFVSTADFEAAESAAPRPEPTGEVVLPPETAAAPEMPVVEPPASEEAAPETAQEEAVAPLVPRFSPEAPLAGPREDFAALSPDLVRPEPPGRVETPRPRPVPRVLPEPAPPPPDALPEDSVLRPELAPSPEAERSEMPEEAATAPPQAVPEPVTEAAPQAPLALQNSSRPRSRPDAPQPQPSRQVAETPVPQPQPQPEREPETTAASSSSLQDRLSQLVADATPPTEPSATAPTRPSGAQSGRSAPLSSSEREGLRLAVQRCWNLPAGLRDAQELKVTLAAELTVTGDVIDGTIRLVAPDPAPDGRYQRAFDAGRRALIRCAPYSSLPADKYDQWRNIEVVFNPEGMVSW